MLQGELSFAQEKDALGCDTESNAIYIRFWLSSEWLADCHFDRNDSEVEKSLIEQQISWLRSAPLEMTKNPNACKQPLMQQVEKLRAG